MDGLFRALSDPTRRAVLERLAQGPASTSELAEPFEMAMPSFLQHLSVLEKAGLVTSTKQGRVRTYRLTPQPLREAGQWLVSQYELWERRLDQFDEYVRSLKEKKEKKP